MHEIINMYSTYDNMHKNKMFYALNFINNHIIIRINCMLSLSLHGALIRRLDASNGRQSREIMEMYGR